MNSFFRLLFVMPLFLFSVVSAHAYIDKSVATVTVMDKTAGKTQNYQIPVGTTFDVDKLTITIKSCKQTDPFQAADSFAFVQIKDDTDKTVFSNWMSRNNPGAHPLQNPEYDVWLVDCE